MKKRYLKAAADAKKCHINSFTARGTMGFPERYKNLLVCLSKLLAAADLQITKKG
jgi:hypothetical protein